MHTISISKLSQIIVIQSATHPGPGCVAQYKSKLNPGRHLTNISRQRSVVWGLGRFETCVSKTRYNGCGDRLKKAPRKRQISAYFCAKLILSAFYPQNTPVFASFYNCLIPKSSRYQLRHMYNICTILVQYLYVYQLYIYCTSIVHILYNGRSWYGECTVKLWWVVGPATWGGRGSGGKLKGPPHGEPF